MKIKGFFQLTDILMNNLVKFIERILKINFRQRQ